MNKNPHSIFTLNVTRGFAICGIIFANMLWFSGYAYLDPEIKLLHQSGVIDKIILLLKNVFIEYKFYTLFSFLFGLGFSLLLSRHNQEKNQHFSRSYIKVICFIYHWLDSCDIFFPRRYITYLCRHRIDFVFYA